MLRRLVVACLITGSAACGPQTASPTSGQSDARVRALADTYLSAYFDRYPEQVTYFGVPGRHHDRLTDNSLDALRIWQSKEDAWLREAKTIDPSTIERPSLHATYAIVREALEASIAARVCRSELWTVSQLFGWHINDGYLVTIQPVGSDQARQESIARWSTLPKYVDTEIANLRQGIKEGYLAPKGNILIVIDQMNILVSTPIAESPFDSPSVRDKMPAFQKDFDGLVKEHINPAFKRYRDFLQDEYLPVARDAVGVSANPQGVACYDASVRSNSSLPVPANEVHAIGLQQVDRIDAEMKTIAQRSFNTTNVGKLLEELRTDRRYAFKSREDLIAYSEAALARAKEAMRLWFGVLPKADVVVQPYPKFREKNGPNEYNAPAEDGTRGGIFYINAYRPTTKTRVPAEDTAFHETIPGHHLQVATALERKDIHPIGRYLGNAGYVEGWALYAERLADEMKLYSSDLDRMGLLSGQALRAVRLVVDSGLHTRGWSRQQAIDYMLAHTAEPKDDVASEVDRYIIAPGQATAYMLGMLEIRAARDEAQKALGAAFAIKVFHDRVLEDGAVPLTFLREKIRKWAAGAS